MRRALVTGASRGIGRALVTELAGRGLEVVATARRVADLDGVPAAARLPLDVTSDASVQRAAEVAGPIDLLVNNAAFSVAAPVEDTPAGVALAMLDTNVVGPLRMISAFLPGMRARGGGTVVNVSSVAGRAVFPLNGVHAASKHALEALSEALAMAAGPLGIRVLVAQLGSVATGMYQQQERYVSSTYAHLDRAQEDSFEEHQAHQASPKQVAAAIADAVADTMGTGHDGYRRSAARADRAGRRVDARRAGAPGRHRLGHPGPRAHPIELGGNRPAMTDDTDSRDVLELVERWAVPP